MEPRHLIPSHPNLLKPAPQIKPLPQAFAGGFTLIEMLAVMTIVGILLAVSVPAFHGITAAARLRGEGGRLAAELARAQQMAVTMNRAVDVRFYRYVDPEDPGSDPAWRAVQFFLAGEGAPAGQDQVLIKLDSATVFSEMPGFSPLLTLPSQDDTLPGIEGSVTSAGFSFFPSGATNLPPVSDSPDGGGWHLTLLAVGDEFRDPSSGPVTNFFSLQIDPHNGSVRPFQP